MRNGLVFHYEIFQRLFVRVVCIKSENFIKFCLAKPEIQSTIFASRQSIIQRDSVRAFSVFRVELDS